MEQIRITVPGIKKSLKTYDCKKSLSEYIWNGFDAGASSVHLDYTDNGIGGITHLTVTDNGSGINYHTLNKTFEPFFESQKDFDAKVRNKVSAVRGKNGVGRLTFFKFSSEARWHTTFGNGNGQRQRFTITVQSDTLNRYQSSELESVSSETGTSVEFLGLFEVTTFQFQNEVTPYLKREFGWFLALNKPRRFQILINGEELDYGDIVGEANDFEEKIGQEIFFVRYIRWNTSLNKEYSRFYFIGSDDRERYKEATTLNNKGDGFYHSLFVKSKYFDTVETLFFSDMPHEEDQPTLLGMERSDKVLRELRARLNHYLHTKRQPFLKASADKLIDSFEREGVFPDYRSNGWELYRHNQLEEFVRGLYQVEPRIFQKLSLEQKKTFTHMLNLIMAEGERESLLEILREIINLSPDDMAMLAEILKTSHLSGVIKTIRLIEDRYRAVKQLQSLVFTKELRADEPHHIQKMVESHYWLFGEQYHLVTAAEQKFEEALRRHTYLLYGEKSSRKIQHVDKNKEMDVFMVRQLTTGERLINNIVVELKNPSVRIGEKELNQVKTYMRVILDQPEFNAANMTWEFYLVGNEFDTTGYIEGELENAQSHGERSLVYKAKQYRIYVKTWSEVFTDFELRHKFLMEKLQLERDKIAATEESADAIVESQMLNTSTQPKTIVLAEE
ncbi:MAG: ATP-binding protein [Anaerolineae bacterium]|nr:ATP-binding protein [Anaerolineae bacterium]